MVRSSKLNRNGSRTISYAMWTRLLPDSAVFFSMSPMVLGTSFSSQSSAGLRS